MQNSFGTLLRSFRQRKQMRLQDVAIQAEIDLNYLSRIEVGTRPAPKKVLRDTMYKVLDLSEVEIGATEASINYKPTNSIFRAPLGAGKIILMVLNAKDVGKLLAGSDLGLEKFVSQLEISEVDMT